VRRHSGLGSVYHIEDTITYFGSDPDCHIRINNPAVGAKHAKIEIDLCSLVIADLTEAGDGVLVNGKPIKGDAQHLVNGDKITIADRSFIIGCPTVPYRELPNKERKKTMGPRILRSMTAVANKRRHSVSRSLLVQVPAEKDETNGPQQHENSDEKQAKRLSQVTYLQLPKETEKLVSDRQDALQKELSRVSTPKSAIKSTANTRFARKSTVRFALPALEEEETVPDSAQDAPLPQASETSPIDCEPEVGDGRTMLLLSRNPCCRKWHRQLAKMKPPPKSQWL